MRVVTLSRTALSQLNTLLVQGVDKFGPKLIANKRDRVYDTLINILAVHPEVKRPHPWLSLCVYPVSGTPFVVIYDFDDRELRVHFIFHRHADLRDLDPASADW